MIARLKLWAVVAGVFVVTLAATWFGGKQSERNAREIKSARDSAKAFRDRERVDDEIQEDADLVQRARSAGIMRPDD
jgi:hypothetical protein